MENETVSEESIKRETTSLEIELNNVNNEIDSSDLDLKMVCDYFKYLEEVGNDPKIEFKAGIIPNDQDNIKKNLISQSQFFLKWSSQNWSSSLASSVNNEYLFI